MSGIITLSSGLRIVHKYIPHVRSVAMGIFVGAGSRAETPSNSGISHFIEHMCFKGTKTRSAFQIVEEIDSLGAQINAFTSKEATAYYTLCIDEYVEKCAEILADLFLNHTFLPEEMDKERGVILEEIAMVEDTPDDLCQELAFKAYWGKNSLGMPILGTADNIRRFTSEDLFAYERSHYVSENTVISFAGNISEEKVIEIVKRYFEIPKGQADKLYMKVDGHGSRYLKRNKTIEQANICIVYPSIKIEGLYEPALNILNCAYGSGMSSILFQRVREQLGLAYSVYSFPSAYTDCGVFSLYVGTNPSSLKKALEAVADINKEIMEKGLTKEEFLRGKQQIKGAYILGQESTLAIMRAMARYALGENEYFDIEKRAALLEEVSKKEVNELIAKIFTSKPSIGYVGRKVDFDIKSIL
ncbi:MAG: insulinase family protein [Clostridia bacterium]|nr:insulinase family protein [Clostridia bacterium]